MVRRGVVDVALEEEFILLVLLEASVETVATPSSQIFGSPASDGGQTWSNILSSPGFRQALSDNRVRSEK